jgi:dienelactone hydrolase
MTKSGKLVAGESMTADPKNQPTNNAQLGDITRRDFGTLLVGAGLAATVQSAAAAGLDVVETDVEIKTPDGTCDATFIHPKTGSHPGVLIWPDAFGLRPSMRAIARRIASEGDGYSVLVPNPFYRVSKAPFTDASTFSFQNADDMAKLRPLMASVNAPGNAEKDTGAYVAFLDAQKEVNKAKKIGTQGYCMGGALVVRTALARPDWSGRIVPRRRLGDRQTRQPASARAEDKGAYVFRDRVQRRLETTRRQGQAQAGLCGR